MSIKLIPSKVPPIISVNAGNLAQITNPLIPISATIW